MTCIVHVGRNLHFVAIKRDCGLQLVNRVYKGYTKVVGEISEDEFSKSTMKTAIVIAIFSVLLAICLVQESDAFAAGGGSFGKKRTAPIQVQQVKDNVVFVTGVFVALVGRLLKSSYLTTVLNGDTKSGKGFFYNLSQVLVPEIVFQDSGPRNHFSETYLRNPSTK